MELTEFMWQGIHDLEIELVEFQSSIVEKNKFEKLFSQIEGTVSERRADNIMIPHQNIIFIKGMGFFTNQFYINEETC